MSPELAQTTVIMRLGDLAKLADAICWLDGRRDFAEQDREQAREAIDGAHTIIERCAGPHAEAIYGKAEEGVSA